MFIVLLSFSSSSVSNQAKCMFLNDEPWMVRPTLIDFNPAELKDYPFMISLDKLSGSWNVLSLKICVVSGTKDINIKKFDSKQKWS